MEEATTEDFTAQVLAMAQDSAVTSALLELVSVSALDDKDFQLSILVPLYKFAPCFYPSVMYPHQSFE